MNIYQFNAYNKDTRAIIVWAKGQLIGSRVKGDNRIALYDMVKFYAEIWYDNDFDNIKFVQGFISTQRLKPYLVAINLNSIL